MARLLILRHGKSQDDADNGKDADRKLIHRGERNAHDMGKIITSHMHRPELVLVSPAVRTLATAEIVQTHLNNVEQITDPRIYNADGETLFDVLTDHGFENKNVLLIGHNPGLIILMHILLAEDGNRAQKSISEFPTASLADMAFEAEKIGDITRASGTIVSLMRPKDLGFH